ncbi:MAG: fibronectin type III domain-containing protein [Chloroflexota bacterium]|nr:fibronectin type III domain-containing protein [Chloroflexota bacterium]
MRDGWPVGRMLGRRAGLGAWSAQRIALAALAAALLLSAAWLGHVAPLLAREGEAPAPEATGASGVTIRIDRLVDRITYTIVDRFQVQLSGLDAATTYEVRVSSDGPRLGIGGCGTAARSQTATVSGGTAQDLLFIVWACGLGQGTVTAEVRAAGAAGAAVTVSQGVTVLPIPDYVPAAERRAAERRAAERSLRGVSGATTPVKTPGIVKNLQHGRFATEIEYTWNEPGSGSFPLSGYGMLMWKGSVQHPGWGEAVNLPTSPRRKRYTGLELNTLYKFRIHACNYDRDNDASYCGWWTDIHEVRTGRKPDPPHTISFDQRSLTSVRAQWSIAADSGGVPRTGFLIRYWPRSNTRDSTTVHVTDKDARRHTLTGLTQGTRYAAKLRTCNDTQSCTVGDWSADHHFETTSVELRPTQPITTPTPVVIDPECPATTADTVPLSQLRVDVVPEAQRRATVCWPHVQNATAYLIRATDMVGNVHTTAAKHWHPVKETTEIPIAAGKPQRHVLNLDKILDESGKDRGLAHNHAYGIRIGVKYANGTILYTTPVIIIDTPITKADGSEARAEVTWDLVGAPAVLNNTNFGTGDYEIRWRQSSGDHTQASWKPNKFSPPPSDVSFRVTPNTHVIGGLAPGSVYALQLIYRDDPLENNDNDADVFAARNAYVWLSSSVADGGQRVAAFPLQQRLGERTADGYPLYAYRICTETFRPSSDTRIAAWVSLINHAMQQWQTATGGQIRTERETDSSGQFKPCADYAGLIRVIANKIAMFMPAQTPSKDKQLKQLIRNFLQRFKDTGIVLDDKKLQDKYGAEDHTMRDIDANEIIMFNEGHPISTITRVAAFPEFAESVRLEESCWYFPSGVYHAGAKMCVPGGDDGADGTRDIFIKRSQYEGGAGRPVDPLAVPAANARFNRCLNQGDDVDLSAYGDFLHEAGHVLGIGGSGSGHPGEEEKEHEFFDSIMDYNPDEAQPNCAPYPLDIMAIYALYQVVVP